ncbi:cell growth-regulating nucleolar protein isoform X2 [Adelges cooleyi]|uniref:cell growth-regulating nucleolar protein isoform X2 n=1 Tax=Adelges cooleyi TaxID=133065 RepID=UPI0021801787|nr:cell growth-regulating nucleolar protein isoform X2 [Adelges cooleyi]
MVVFTCNNCGDSVSKPKIEKHMQYECKRKHFAVSFCCVDCLKDFNQDTVKDHCQCVTEEQRYSAKGFVAKVEKGKKKQAGWVDIVRSVMDRTDLEKDEQQFLSLLSNYDNVPRKKSKFQNFCFSTAPAYRKKGYLIDKVFDMIETEFKAQQAVNSNNNTKKSENTNNSQSANDNTSSKKVTADSSFVSENQENNDVTVKTSKKKKSLENGKADEDSNEKDTQSEKKKKKKKSLDNNIVVENLEVNLEESSELQSKKKKKKSILNGIVVEENGVNSEETIDSQSEKKKKKKKSIHNGTVIEENGVKSEETIEPQSEKKKKNKKSLENGVVVNENENINDNKDIVNKENHNCSHETEVQLSKKDKKAIKKQLKYQKELENVSSGIVEEDHEPLSKKKKRKLTDNEEKEEPQQKIAKTETPQIPEIQNGKKFVWEEAILQVLQSKKGKSIAQSKVIKRVLNEYHLLNEVAKKTENELEKICLKKLKKLKNIKIENDKVQLIEC